MANVVFENVQKTYPDGTQAIFDLSFEVESGEFAILVGPSGCGKSTALRMIAGLEEITGGEIRIGQRVVNHLSPKERDIAMVFQSYALYPHMTVRENMGFALKLSKVPKQEIDARVEDAATKLGLMEYLHRKPKALSGGQRQRVAMGRAIVRSPKAFLMDEPLSNLDAKLRVQMRAEIAALQDSLGSTMVYVTHDQVEAMTMGDRVAVMLLGRLQQYAAPKELYDRPANLFVAGFMGSPGMNICKASVQRGPDSLQLVLDGGKSILDIPEDCINCYPRLPDYVGRDLAFGVRPEHLVDPRTVRDGQVWKGRRVTLVEELGANTLVHLQTQSPPVITDETRAALDDDDLIDEMTARAASGGQTFVQRASSDERVEIGDTIDVGVRLELAHFFDLETGAVLR